MTTDPRTARTRARLRAALLAECADRPLSDVSVSALTRRTGIGRATFYLHYDDLTALAVDACAGVVREAVEALHTWHGVPDPAHPPEPLIGFFGSAARNAQLYRALLRPGGSGPLGELLHRELRARSLAERERSGTPNADLAASAVAATFTGVFADWLHGQLGQVDGPPEEIASRIWRLLLALHRAAT